MREEDFPLDKLKITKQLGGLEDLLTEAEDIPGQPQPIWQYRGPKKQLVKLHKINIDTLAAYGEFGKPGFKSIRQYIIEEADKCKNLIKYSSDTDYIYVNYNNRNNTLVVTGTAYVYRFDKNWKLTNSNTVVDNRLDFNDYFLILSRVELDNPTQLLKDLLLPNKLYGGEYQ